MDDNKCAINREPDGKTNLGLVVPYCFAVQSGMTRHGMKGKRFHSMVNNLHDISLHINRFVLFAVYFVE